MRRRICSCCLLLLMGGMTPGLEAQQSTSIVEQFNASSVYANQDPLAGAAEVMPPESGNPPKCNPPVSTWQLLAQQGGECYYFAPFAKRLNGYVTSIENVAAVERLGGRCGLDEFNAGDAVCFNPGDDLPGASPTTGLPTGISTSQPINPYGGGTGSNTGGTGGTYGSPMPGPAGGIGYKPGPDPCRPFGPGGYDYCDDPPGTRKPPGCTCGTSGPLRAGVQSNPKGSSPRFQASIALPAPCKHLRAPYNNKIILNNAQDVVQHIFDNYGTGKPIEITKVIGQPNTYLVVLAGTEIGAGQANMINPLGAPNPFQPLGNMFQQIIQEGISLNMATFAQSLTDLLTQRQLISYIMGQLDVDLKSAQGGKTQYQTDILHAMLNQIPRGANIIVAGHSLGGMDGENLIANSAIQFYYHPVELITYGSPITQPPVAGVKYVRYSSPNDIVRLTALGSWISNPSQWIYVNNPGQNPELAPFFQPGSNPQLMVQTVVGGLMAAHLKYTVSPDLAQYSALGGTKSSGTVVLLDATDDNCYDAPSIPATTPTTAK